MRVTFDEQIFLLQPQGGVSRYFVELLRHLPTTTPPIDVRTPFRHVVNRHALDAFGARFSPARGPLQPYPQLVAAVSKPGRDASTSVVHHTFYAPGFLRKYPGIPKVVTIHDMIPEILGTRGRFGNPHMAIREYVRRADLLIFVSRSAETDLLDQFGTPAGRRVVIHHGVDGAFFDGGPAPAGLPDDYILFVGKREGYKDFATLLAAFSEARDQLRDIHLVCVGGGPLSVDEVSRAAAVGLRDRIHQRSLADSEMPGAYANAAAFVFPSRYEGFGLPALEAMASGTPTILAKTSSLPEVGGDAAVYFSPGDAGELAASLVAVLDDRQHRADLIERGVVRARQFSWARTAQQTADAYRLLTGGHESVGYSS